MSYDRNHKVAQVYAWRGALIINFKYALIDRNGFAFVIFEPRHNLFIPYNADSNAVLPNWWQKTNPKIDRCDPMSGVRLTFTFLSLIICLISPFIYGAMKCCKSKPQQVAEPDREHVAQGGE